MSIFETSIIAMVSTAAALNMNAAADAGVWKKALEIKGVEKAFRQGIPKTSWSSSALRKTPDFIVRKMGKIDDKQLAKQEARRDILVSRFLKSSEDLEIFKFVSDKQAIEDSAIFFLGPQKQAERNTKRACYELIKLAKFKQLEYFLPNTNQYVALGDGTESSQNIGARLQDRIQKQPEASDFLLNEDICTKDRVCPSVLKAFYNSFIKEEKCKAQFNRAIDLPLKFFNGGEKKDIFNVAPDTPAKIELVKALIADREKIAQDKQKGKQEKEKEAAEKVAALLLKKQQELDLKYPNPKDIAQAKENLEAIKKIVATRSAEFYSYPLTEEERLVNKGKYDAALKVEKVAWETLYAMEHPPPS